LRQFLGQTVLQPEAGLFISFSQLPQYLYFSNKTTPNANNKSLMLSMNAHSAAEKYATHNAIANNYAELK